MVCVVPVRATIASGKVLRIDSGAARTMTGVLLVMDHNNVIPLYRNASGGRNSEARPCLSDYGAIYWPQ